MFDDLVKVNKPEESEEEKEEKYEICGNCDAIMIEGENCDCDCEKEPECVKA